MKGFQFCVGDLGCSQFNEWFPSLAKGSLLSIQSDAVEIRLNQSLRSPPGYSSPEECLWVIDKDELSSGFDRARGGFDFFFSLLFPTSQLILVNRIYFTFFSKGGIPSAENSSLISVPVF